MTQTALKLDHRQSQSQTLTPRLQYAVRLLQLSALDYEQELHEMLARNPFLEIDESAAARHAAPDAALGTSNGTPDRHAADTPGDRAEHEADNFDDRDREHGHEQEHEHGHEHEHGNDHDGGVEHDSWLQSPGAMRDGAKESRSDPRTSAVDMMVADTDLRQYLRSQANLLPLSARDHALVCSVVESLDDDGYLRTELAEIGELAGLEPAADESELTTALRLVQSFDPAGCGARSVGECLTLQLEKLAPGVRETAGCIVADHLDRLAQRDTSGIARRLGCGVGEVEAACIALRRLDPRPGWRFSRPDAHYVSPDVTVQKVRGKWVAQLNGAVVPQVRLNRSYADLFQRHRDAQHAELGAHLQEARWTIRNVEQRFSTILAVAQAILRRQYLFFEYGPLAMKPLALRDIAEEIGVHESTVCRVTNNKYMATPSGLFELKQFFSRPMQMAGGGACSATAIRGVVKELIDAEDPRRPLSDVDLAQRLARQGLTVARRTVTKYRQALKIAPADRRRTGAEVVAG